MTSNTSRTRLRQIALVAQDLDKSEKLLTEVLGTEVIFVDSQVEQWGLHNFLVAIGGDVIEVVSPFKDNTTAGRLLSKRGDGGYMIIMQTDDAAKRRDMITSKGLAKVIFGYKHDDCVMVQYHPKGIKGGMMPELDSQSPTPGHSDPLLSRFSPWHPCGKDYAAYSAGFQRRSHLHLAEAVLRLPEGDSDTYAAAKQWETLFGIPSQDSELSFTNAKMRFVKGVKGQPEGLESITIAVEGDDQFQGILKRASERGLCGDGWINMLGVKWYFTHPNMKVLESRL